MDQIYDVIIIGGGAAATSAAMTLKNRGKTFAVVSNKVETGSLYKAEKITNYPGIPDASGKEISEILPNYFIRINKSSLANRKQIERFSAAFSGSVDVIFKSGYRDYVSRRCFAEIKKELK